MGEEGEVENRTYIFAIFEERRVCLNESRSIFKEENNPSLEREKNEKT